VTTSNEGGEAGGAAHLFNLFVGVLFFSFFSAAASGGIFELPTYVRTYSLGAIPTFRVFQFTEFFPLMIRFFRQNLI
jgi:hypothetical protein